MIHNRFKAYSEMTNHDGNNIKIDAGNFCTGAVGWCCPENIAVDFINVHLSEKRQLMIHFSLTYYNIFVIYLFQVNVSWIVIDR